MRPCEKCLENNWHFKKIEDIIRATCTMCGYEVEFAARGKNKLKELKEGGDCRKCNGKLYVQKLKFKPKKLKRLYYYTAVYKCDKCNTFFYSNKFRVYN